MKAARDLACDWAESIDKALGEPFGEDINTVADTLARLIEARDREHAAALSVAREALDTLRRMASKPYKSWDTGAVVDAVRVEEITEEALAALDGLTIQEVSNAEDT